MEIHVKIDMYILFVQNTLGLNKKKCIFIISIFMKKISLKERNKTRGSQEPVIAHLVFNLTSKALALGSRI